MPSCKEQLLCVLAVTVGIFLASMGVPGKEIPCMQIFMYKCMQNVDVYIHSAMSKVLFVPFAPLLWRRRDSDPYMHPAEAVLQWERSQKEANYFECNIQQSKLYSKGLLLPIAGIRHRPMFTNSWIQGDQDAEHQRAHFD